MRIFQRMQVDWRPFFPMGNLFTVRELTIADMTTILMLQDVCFAAEEKMGQRHWTSKLDKYRLMSILVSGFILGLFDCQNKLVGYCGFYHLDPDQPVSYYAQKLKEFGIDFDLNRVAECKKPRIHPQYRGHRFGRDLLETGIKAIRCYYPEMQAAVLAIPAADEFSSRSFEQIGFKKTRGICLNRSGEERELFVRQF